MIWFFLCYPLLIGAILLQLATFWYVYGVWPISWGAFWLFAFLTYAQGEAAKFVVKRMLESFKEKK